MIAAVKAIKREQCKSRILSLSPFSTLLTEKSTGGEVIVSSSVVDILKIGKKARYKIKANTFNNKNPKE